MGNESYIIDMRGFAVYHKTEDRDNSNISLSLNCAMGECDRNRINEIEDKDIRNFQKIQNTCMICQEEKGAVRRYIEVFINNFEDADLQFAFKNSFGLCLPHLLTLLELCKDAKISAEVLNIETAKIKNNIEELKEFERKHDYRFSNEKFGAEGDSWIRAMEKLIGKEGIF